MSLIIAPSLLSADFLDLKSELQRLEGEKDIWLHLDVMDGHFVPNLTIGIPVVAALKKISPLPLDVHLMIEEPERYVEDFVRAGSDYLTIHVEASKDVRGTLQKIRNLGAKPGLTLRPRTSLDLVLPHLDLCDLVLVMTVEPGFGGQSFMSDQVVKIDRLAEERTARGLEFLIEVDGGISDKTVSQVRNADVLVAGSYVFKNDYRDAIARLKQG